jgi:acetyl-CoA C-acetyltransferase
VAACRTAIGNFLGSLSPLSAVELGTAAVREAISRAGLHPEQVDEVILGNVIGAGLGQNPARQTAMKSGIPATAGAFTVNKVCGSGLKAVMLAAQSVRLGETEASVAGGMESMSHAPYLLPGLRAGARLGNTEAIDSMIHDGLWCALENQHMGRAAELIARLYSISRQEQDLYASESHRRAVQAARRGDFAEEIVPVRGRHPMGEWIDVLRDERPRESDVEDLARLKPVFEEQGTVTAGNAPGVNDGAAALVVASDGAARRLGTRPLARIVAQAASGVEPARVMMAPVPAFHKLLALAGWHREEIDLIELNEAFSVQAIAVIRELRLDPARVNICGGAVALGHPIGASGARILVTLLHALRRTGGRRGVAMLCMGGGNGLALAVEMV